MLKEKENHILIIIILCVLQWFNNTVKGDDSLPAFLPDMFTSLEPIYQFHIEFLKEVETRLALWEGKSNAHLNGDYQRIGDIMVNSFLTSLGVSPYLFSVLCHYQL